MDRRRRRGELTRLLQRGISINDDSGSASRLHSGRWRLPSLLLRDPSKALPLQDRHALVGEGDKWASYRPPFAAE